ncbi:MAG: hypothetical protein NUV52_04770, partial [Candidatus Roizmanbacteria bacterium]|nr:hypothetical protein [Candidatus Roizmanbacteria bacterium]
MEKIISFIKHHTLLVLIGITFVVYIPSFFGGFLWDDEDFVFANKHVADFNVEKFFTDSATAGRGKKSNYYRPLQLTTYAFEHAIFGFNPFIFHLSNILWHIAAGVMVYLVMRSIRISWAFSLGATLIFLLHPIQTEAVSYVSGRSDMMFMFFLLLSFLCNQKRETRFVLVSTFFFICALLSKESGLLAFAIFPTLSLIQYGFSPQLIHALKRYMPHMLIAIVYLLLRFTVLEFITSYETWGDTPYSTSVIVRLATFLRNYFFYWQVLLFPFNLHMERDESTVKIVTSLISHWTVWFVTTQALFIGLLWWLYKKNQQYGILAIGGYIGMHGIMGFYSGVILLNGIFYEHYLYSALPFFA